MLIDIHAHLWDKRFRQNKAEIIKACELYGIDKVYVSGLGVHYPTEEEVKRLNYEVYKFMQEAPGKIGGFCYVSPQHSCCMDDLIQGIEEFGMSGMKLWVATHCDDPRVFPLVEKCIDYKVPILVHSFHKAYGQLEHESTGVNVANLAKHYPEAKIIMAHLSSNCHREIKTIMDYKNVSVDISGSLFRRDDVDYTKKLIGAERILFGTDMPGASFLVNYGQIEEADLTPRERDLIYFENALKLLERK